MRENTAWGSQGRTAKMPPLVLVEIRVGAPQVMQICIFKIELPQDCGLSKPTRQIVITFSLH